VRPPRVEWPPRVVDFNYFIVSALLPRNNSHRHEFTVISLLYGAADRDTAQDRQRPRAVHHRSTVHLVASDSETLLPKKFAGSYLRRRNFAGRNPAWY